MGFGGRAGLVWVGLGTGGASTEINQSNAFINWEFQRQPDPEVIRLKMNP